MQKQPARQPAKISVLVADAIPLMADALAGMLAHEPDLRVAATHPGTGIETIEAVTSLKPDVALLDYWMPDMEGAALVRVIKARQPERKLIVLSWFHGTREIEQSLDAGADGFLPKSLRVEQVVEAIRRAHAGESPVYLQELEELFLSITRRGAATEATWRQLQYLTTRQLQVLALLSENLSPKEVAKKLGLSQDTVRIHIRKMLEKTGTHSYTDVIIMARSAGLIRT